MAGLFDESVFIDLYLKTPFFSDYSTPGFSPHVTIPKMPHCVCPPTMINIHRRKYRGNR
jgi:hypothetical protein